MSGLELNKIIASILLASLIAMLVGKIADILYKPNLQPEHRGYSINTNLATENPINAESNKQQTINIAGIMKNANAELGKKIISKCISCHTFEKGAPHKVGPNLWNIFGSTKGELEGYKFSSALANKGGIWDEESLFAFLSKPSKYIPGTKMSFIGLEKPEDIANVIMFLKTQAHD